MKIETDTVVTLRYKVADPLGRLLDAGREPMAYLHGGHGNTLPAIEAALEGREAGYHVMLQLKPADAFGERDDSLLRTIPKSEFPPGVKVGGQLEGPGANGEPRLFNVVKIKGDQVLLDGNHPLAGKEIRLYLWVLSVRAATAEEVTHGHVHGEHGHHH